MVEMINAVAADVRNRTMWPSRESSQGHRSAARLGLASVLVVLRPACCAFWGNWDRRKAAHTVAELSFPTKLTTYLAAGSRVLLHAPNYASVTSFMQHYAIGHSCDSLESSDLAAALSDVDRMPQSGIDEAIDAARRNEFNSHTFVQRFQTLIGISRPGASAPASPEMAGQV